MIVTATEFKSNLGKYLDMVATQESAANKAARINFFRLLFIVNAPLFFQFSAKHFMKQNIYCI